MTLKEQGVHGSQPLRFNEETISSSYMGRIRYKGTEKTNYKYIRISRYPEFEHYQVQVIRKFNKKFFVAAGSNFYKAEYGSMLRAKEAAITYRDYVVKQFPPGCLVNISWNDLQDILIRLIKEETKYLKRKRTFESDISKFTDQQLKNLINDPSIPSLREFNKTMREKYGLGWKDRERRSVKPLKQRK